MSELSEYLELIKNEKDTKLLPKNIISGITILGVPGNSDFALKIDASVSNQTGIQNYITEANNIDLTTITITTLASLFASCPNLKKASFKSANNITDMNNMFVGCKVLEEIDLSDVDTSNVTNMNSMFNMCQKLTAIPQLNTSKVTNMYRMCYACVLLEDLPLLDTSKVTNWEQAFYYCEALTNESLNNILQMCINATSYAGTKTLATLGFNANWCSASKIQGLSNYQSFLNAGWTIGY